MVILRGKKKKEKQNKLNEYKYWSKILVIVDMRIMKPSYDNIISGRRPCYSTNKSTGMDCRPTLKITWYGNQHGLRLILFQHFYNRKL